MTQSDLILGQLAQVQILTFNCLVEDYVADKHNQPDGLLFPEITFNAVKKQQELASSQFVLISSETLLASHILCEWLFGSWSNCLLCFFSFSVQYKSQMRFNDQSIMIQILQIELCRKVGQPMTLQTKGKKCHQATLHRRKWFVMERVIKPVAEREQEW